MKVTITDSDGIPVAYISQNITVIGWTHEQAVESSPYLHVILNDLIKNNKIEIVLEVPKFGIYIYKIPGADMEKASTFSFLVDIDLQMDIYSIAGSCNFD
ncbi:hypothetical protein [Dyadobacter sp. CY356]|uniref:hypothetical protein n=1 Tax=Dyadobacter sp. CY356 TaxID=2906442 RepID=UPI001F20BCAB|nr:hypothetical protein [Dyadobacter sp. CY356]MCF0057149.1 hypothetical protein [Dyadobacter sp. CY356]